MATARCSITSRVVYGSNMSNSNAHDHFPLPNLVIGNAAAAMKGGGTALPDHTPMSNLLLTALERVGVHEQQLGDQHGRAQYL
jgi:hypothetical protein